MDAATVAVALPPPSDDVAMAPSSDNGTLAPTAVAPPPSSEEQLASKMQALTLVQDDGESIFVRDIHARPENMVAKARNASELHNLLSARFGMGECVQLMDTDAAFHKWLDVSWTADAIETKVRERVAAAVAAWEAQHADETTPEHRATLESEARAEVEYARKQSTHDIWQFAAFVDQNASLEYHRPELSVIASVTPSGAALCVRRMIGVAPNGWMAVLGGGAVDGPCRLCLAHVSWITDDGQLRWHYHGGAFASDTVQCASITNEAVALWCDADMQLSVTVLGGTKRDAGIPASVHYSLRDYLTSPPVAVYATAHHAVLLTDAAGACVVWLQGNGRLGRAADDDGATLWLNDLTVEPEQQTATHVPRNPLTGEPLEDLAGLGTPNGTGDRLRQVHKPVSAAFDDHCANVLLLGTDKGCVLLVLLSDVPGVADPLGVRQMGTSNELDAADKRSHHMYPGLEPVLAVRGRAAELDGTIVTIMAHSMSVRCGGAIQTQLAGATTRMPCWQGRDGPAMVDAAMCGHTLLAHRQSDNALFIGSMVPAPSGRVERYAVTTNNLAPAVLPFPRAATRYRSMCLAMTCAHVLMPDGRVARLRPASDADNAGLNDAIQEAERTAKTAGQTAAAATTTLSAAAAAPGTE